MALNFGVICFALIIRTAFDAWKQLVAKRKPKMCGVDCRARYCWKHNGPSGGYPQEFEGKYMK